MTTLIPWVVQVNRGQWGGLAGAPLGALAHLLAAWLGGFREPVLCGAALHAVLRLAAALAEVCVLSTRRVCPLGAGSGSLWCMLA